MSDEMTGTSAENEPSPLQRIRRSNAAGNEHWSSRDFARVLGYSDYRNFAQVIGKAKIAAVLTRIFGEAPAEVAAPEALQTR